LKSIAWHRLIYNNLNKNVKCTLPEEFAITDIQDEISASRKLLERLSYNLTHEWHTRSSNTTTVDILSLCIISKQKETMVVETTTKTDDVLYHEELSADNVNLTTFTGCQLNGNVLDVTFGDLKFSIVVRFKNRYPTFDIYYNYEDKK